MKTLAIFVLPFIAAVVVGRDLVKNLPCERIPGANKQRGNLWMHDGYSYCKSRSSEKSGTIYMYCRMRNVCAATARLTRQGIFVVSSEHRCHNN